MLRKNNLVMRRINFLYEQFLAICVIALFLANPNLLFAQKTYSTRQSKGELPKDFLTKSSEKYKKALEQIGKKEKRSEKSLKKQFFLESSFSIDRLLQSGVVLYDPEFSGYLHQVADKVLGSDKKMVENARFYVVRSPAVNAFATSEGMIFVCMGLLAQLENEAQLGFVLSHEVIHTREKHAVNMYVKVDKLNKSMSTSDAMRHNSVERGMLERSKFSKSLELEADTKGFKDYYVKSGYSFDAISGAFDVMRYSDLPFDEEAFDKKFLEGSDYVFPKEYFLEKIEPIQGAAENKADSLSTHPNIGTRRENIAKIIKEMNLSGGQEYLVSEPLFKKWQSVSRLELPQLQVHNGSFQDAIYTAYLLLKESPDDLYLKKSVAKALYGYAKFSNRATAVAESMGNDGSDDGDDRDDDDSDKPKIEGESQQVYHLLKTLDMDETFVLAAKYLWTLRKAHPEDKEIDWLARDIVRTMSAYSKDELAYIAKSKSEKNPEEAAKAKKEKDEKIAKDKKATEEAETKKKGKKSKYDKIKEKQEEKVEEKKDTTVNKKAYMRYALVDFFADTAFTNSIERGKKFKKEIEEWKENASVRKAYYAKRDKNLKQGNRMGIDKVVVVNPYYLSVDMRKENAVEYLKTEDKAAKFRQSVIDNAKAANIEVDLLAPNELRANDIEKYNDLALLNEWVDEQIDYGRMDFSGYQADKIAELSKKYNTRYFLWTGVISMRKTKNIMNAAYGVLLSMSIIGAPLGVYLLVKPEYETVYYSVLYDTKTNTSKLIKYESMRTTDADYLIDMQVYDTFAQLKAKPNEKDNAEAMPSKTKSKTKK